MLNVRVSHASHKNNRRKDKSRSYIRNKDQTNYFLERIKQYNLKSDRQKKVCMTWN